MRGINCLNPVKPAKRSRPGSSFRPRLYRRSFTFTFASSRVLIPNHTGFTFFVTPEPFGSNTFVRSWAFTVTPFGVRVAFITGATYPFD